MGLGVGRYTRGKEEKERIIKMTYLYQTKAVNEDGVDGYSYIEGEDPIKVAHPLSEDQGFNPEKFVGLALSTCFNSTVQKILEEDGLDNKTRVKVAVQMHEEEDETGFYFSLDADLTIDQMDLRQVQEYLERTKVRCPMAKLLKGSATVSYAVTTY